MNIHIFESCGCHHFSLAGDTQPDARSRGYLSRQEATKAGITTAMVRGLSIESVIGGDRKTARALGVKPLGGKKNGTNGTDGTDAHAKAGTMSSAKIKALAKAQAAHRDAIEQHRKSLVCPEGFRSMDHFLDSVAERCGRVYGGQGELVKYLGSNSKSVSRWLKKKQYPLQTTIDAIARWYACAK